jgi:serine protease Do
MSIVSHRILKLITLIASLSATLAGISITPTSTRNLLSPAWAQTTPEQTTAKLYQQSSPAVVTIKNGGQHGSGFLVSSDGLIITNAHVVANGPRIVTVVFPNGQQAAADLLGFAKDGIDLAALQIYQKPKLPFLTLARPDTIQVGQSIFVIGTPFDEAYQNTLSKGIISRLDRTQGILQHDANTNPGSSGGPVLNTQGQIVGVHFGGNALNKVYDSLGQVIGHTKSSINFAISLDRLQTFLQSVHKGNLAATPTLSSQQQQNPVTAINLQNQTLQGNFIKGSAQLSNGAFYHGYQFKGQVGQTVVFEMNSTDFDPTLTLGQIKTSPEGTELVQVANNSDRGANNFNARIRTQLPAEGQYLILANSAQPGEVGHYTLKVTAFP